MCCIVGFRACFSWLRSFVESSGCSGREGEGEGGRFRRWWGGVESLQALAACGGMEIVHVWMLLVPGRSGAKL